MKVAVHVRSRKPRLNLRSQTFTLSTAKTYLGRLVQKASRGETVYIVTGQRRFVLQEVAEIEPIPMRPAGYFADAYSKAEIQEDNRLAKASVIRAPGDLE
jgi:soluble P-type ATPase